MEALLQHYPSIPLTHRPWSKLPEKSNLQNAVRQIRINLTGRWWYGPNYRAADTALQTFKSVRTEDVSLEEVNQQVDSTIVSYCKHVLSRKQKTTHKTWTCVTALRPLLKGTQSKMALLTSLRDNAFKFMKQGDLDYAIELFNLAQTHLSSMHDSDEDLPLAWLNAYRCIYYGLALCYKELAQKERSDTQKEAYSQLNTDYSMKYYRYRAKYISKLGKEIDVLEKKDEGYYVYYHYKTLFEELPLDCKKDRLSAYQKAIAFFSKSTCEHNEDAERRKKSFLDQACDEFCITFQQETEKGREPNQAMYTQVVHLLEAGDPKVANRLRTLMDEVYDNSQYPKI